MSIFEEFESTSLDAWIEKIKQDLKGKDYTSTLQWNSDENITVAPVYHGDNIATNKAMTYTIERNVEWEMTERISLSSGIEESNKQALEALKGGTNSIYFTGEVKTSAELNQLLNGIMLDIISTHFYTNSPARLKELLNDYCSTNELNSDELNLYVYSDPLGEALVSGSNHQAILSEEHYVVGGIHYANAGANAVQELAYSLNQAVEYVHHKTEQGSSSEDALSSIHFHLGIGTHFFMEVAKFRALRILWKLISESYGSVTACNIHAETSSYYLSGIDVDTNILRGTTGAMSALLGGCDVLCISPFDEANNTSGFSRRIARNIQIILKEEAYFGKVNDMVKGSYYIESLTDELVAKALELFKSIEADGGFLTNIQNNTIQVDIEKVADTKSNAYINNERTFLGVNKHRNPKKDHGQVAPVSTSTGVDFTALSAKRLSDIIENQSVTEKGGIVS